MLCRDPSCNKQESFRGTIDQAGSPSQGNGFGTPITMPGSQQVRTMCGRIIVTETNMQSTVIFHRGACLLSQSLRHHFSFSVHMIMRSAACFQAAVCNRRCNQNEICQRKACSSHATCHQKLDLFYWNLCWPGLEPTAQRNPSSRSGKLSSSAHNPLRTSRKTQG